MDILTIKLDKSNDAVGIDVEFGLPDRLNTKFPDEVKSISNQCKDLSQRIADLFERDMGDLKMPSEVRIAVEKAKAFGEMARLLKDISPEHISAEERDKLNQMVQMSELATLVEKMANCLK